MNAIFTREHKDATDWLKESLLLHNKVFFILKDRRWKTTHDTHSSIVHKLDTQNSKPQGILFHDKNQ